VQRRIIPDSGATLVALLDDLWIAASADATTDSSVRDILGRAIDVTREATAYLLTAAGDDVLAGATPYLELTSTTVASALLLVATGAARARGDVAAAELEVDARFFAIHRLIPTLALGDVVRAGIDVIPAFAQPQRGT
jgi:hypothetical protein